MRAPPRDAVLVLMGTLVLDALVAPFVRELVNGTTNAALYALEGVTVVLFALNAVGVAVAVNVWRKR